MLSRAVTRATAGPTVHRRLPPRRCRSRLRLCRAQAAGLVTSEHSVAVRSDRRLAARHRRAAYAELDVAPPLESFVLRGHDPTDRTELRRRDPRPASRGLDRDRRASRSRRPLRTAVDLACKLSRRERAGGPRCASLAPTACTARTCSALLPRYFRRRGVVQARQLVPLVDGRAESQPESWTRLEIVRSGTPDAGAAVVGQRRRRPDVPARSGVPPRSGRRRVRRGGVPLEPRGT